MDLNALLAEVDGIGSDQFIPSSRRETTPRAAESAERVAAEAPREAAVPPPEPALQAVPPVQADMEMPMMSSPDDGADSLGMVLDVELEMTVELGQARIPLKQLLGVQAGDQLALAQCPEDLLNIYVNDRLVAHGEAVVVDNTLAVRIVDLITTPDVQLAC